MQARPISAVVLRPVEWLWPGHLALGTLAMLEGDPDLGKTYLLLDLCARLSSGQPFPDGAASPGPANSLLLCAEDNEADTLAPRLAALGADPARVFVWPCESPASFPSQSTVLDDMLIQTDARLVVFDPILAFLDKSVNPYNDASVRRALRPLSELAQRRRCVAMMVRHLAKRLRGPAIYRGATSIAFTAVCRSVWLAARDPEQPGEGDSAGRCVLAQVKNNRAARQPSLSYELAPAPGGLPPGGSPVGGSPVSGLPTVRWLGVSTWRPDDLTLYGGDGPERARAKTVLAECLAHGPRTSREIRAAARGHGLSRRTLFRAKADLEIRCERRPYRGALVCFWLLPGQQVPDRFQPDGELDLDPWLKPFEEAAVL